LDADVVPRLRAAPTPAARAGRPAVKRERKAHRSRGACSAWGLRSREGIVEAMAPTAGKASKNEAEPPSCRGRECASAHAEAQATEERTGAMEGNPKRNTTLRLDETVKRAAADALATCGMTLTQGVEEYLEQTAYEGAPPSARAARPGRTRRACATRRGCAGRASPAERAARQQPHRQPTRKDYAMINASNAELKKMSARLDANLKDEFIAVLDRIGLDVDGTIAEVRAEGHR